MIYNKLVSHNYLLIFLRIKYYGKRKSTTIWHWLSYRRENVKPSKTNKKSYLYTITTERYFNYNGNGWKKEVFLYRKQQNVLTKKLILYVVSIYRFFVLFSGSSTSTKISPELQAKPPTHASQATPHYVTANPPHRGAAPAISLFPAFFGSHFSRACAQSSAIDLFDTRKVNKNGGWLGDDLVGFIGVNF